MSPSQDIVRPQFELRIDGIADTAIRFRMSHDEPCDFDVLFDDAILGTLAITPDCILELREADADWHAVTLDELKGILLGDSESLTTNDLTQVSDTVEWPRLDRLNEVGAIHRRSLADLTGHTECLKRVQSLFYGAGLPYKTAGTVLIVPNVRLARAVLCQGGFYPSEISPVALVEPQTQCAVQLIEERI